ncbi:MAG: N-acetyltransferase [Gemmatimonadetes bacterium]|nr:N-acetyltransferase [Gemmatimonadota bacterium]
MPDVSPQVTHDPATGRFEIHTEQGTALLDYRHRGADLDLIHTEVPQALEGRGYAAALATSALDYARREGMRVIPSCPYVKAYIDRHPQYEDLVAPR